MFTCSYCNERFSDQSFFLKHIRYVHAFNTSFDCDKNCGRTYSTYDALRRHISSKHSFNACSSIEFPEKVLSSLSTTKIIDCYDSYNVERGINYTSKENEVNSAGYLNKLKSKKDRIKKIKLVIEQPILKNDYKKELILFAAKLHNYPDIARGRAGSIIKDVKELVVSLTNNLKHEIVESVSVNINNSTEISKKICQDVVNACNNSHRNMEQIETEWKIFKNFEELNTYIKPETYEIGERKDYVYKNGIKILTPITITAEFIPLRHVFKAFFEIPGIFDATVQYMNLLNENRSIICNFIQGSLWANIIQDFSGKIVIPLILYYDDYENNNPLGSHRGLSKCGAVYISIPCLPLEMQSKLENIFLFILFNTLDLTVCTNKIVFQKAIEELKYLENVGITIHHKDGEKQIFFKLCLVVGDNLAVHTILGFTKSFNSSIFCRFCYVEKRFIHTIFHESECTLRTKIQYDKDLREQNPQKTGVTEPCIFHSISNFHVTQNLTVDVMHDVLEGVAQYDLGLYLNFFIKSKKYFNLNTLNNLIKGFDYGQCQNKPPEILEDQINKKRLIMSASEMLCLIRHIQLIIGHLIPVKDDAWELLKQLCDIVELVVSSYLHISFGNTMKIKISDYLQSLASFSDDKCIKPKHHLLIHYGSVFLAVGPLWKISSMRYESKNREGKITSRVSVNRKNVCHTIAIKHQLRFNYRLLRESSPIVDQSYSASEIALEYVHDIQFFYRLLPQEIQKSKSVHITEKIVHDGNYIERGSVLMMPEENGPSFYTVHEIIIRNDDQFTIVAKLLLDVFLDEHMHLYEIVTTSFLYAILPSSTLYGYVITNSVRTPNGKHFIAKNWL